MTDLYSNVLHQILRKAFIDKLQFVNLDISILDIGLRVVSGGEVRSKVHSEPVIELGIDIEVRRSQVEVGAQFQRGNSAAVFNGDTLKLNRVRPSDPNLKSVERSIVPFRSEERRVGKERRYRGAR